jgi:hypothetical protein
MENMVEYFDSMIGEFMEKIKVKKIVITRLEGPVHKCDCSKEFNSFKAADEWMWSEERTFPKDGYDKHQVTVEWEDGTEWKIRIDAHHPDSERFRGSDNSIPTKIYSLCNWYGNPKNVGGPDQKMNEEIAKGHREFLDTHEVLYPISSVYSSITGKDQG